MIGLSKPEGIKSRLEELGIESAGISDHNTLSGSIDFYKGLKKTHKPILGTQINVCLESATVHEKENRHTYHLNLVAKNKVGWKNLIKLITLSNKPENFYHKARLSIEQIQPFTEGLIAFSGGENSILAADTDKQKKNLISVFGADSFFVETQLFNRNTVLCDQMRAVAKEMGVRCVATANPYYPKREDAYDQRVLLCSLLSTTFPQIQYRLNEGDDEGIANFFAGDNFHIPSYDEMVAFGHTEEELANTGLIGDMCETYDVLSKPLLPDFKCPEGFNPDTYLRQLCRNGWKEKLGAKSNDTYVETIKMELGVLQGAGLSSYFLILNDICNFIKSKGWLPNVGRGSAAGCIVSYLTDIIQVDPVQYGLIFSRFYNEGRNTKDRVSMPDIDLDVPASKRDEVIDYIKSVYGQSKVGQICAFQTMKGRGAMKEVLRAYGVTPFETMNRITEPIPDEARIADDLQIMKEEEGESSIIKWSLENEPKKFEEWVRLNDDGSLDGPLAKRFEQAIRLEGTRKSYGKHASGIVISSEDLGEVCPMVLDKKNDNLMCGLEMKNLEDIGLVKFDILGLSLMDKLQGVADILRYGDINE